jgi:serine/threonine protein phosphatase PrpC
MTAQDILTIGALLVAAVAVAYALGSRKAARESVPKPAPERAAVEKVEKAEKADEAAKAETTTAPSDAGAPEAAAAVAAAKVVEEPALAKLEYEEDDDIDPTKIGATNVAPTRAVYQPPVQRIVYDDDAEDDHPTGAQSLFLVSAAAQTDTGRRRKRNEDSLLIQENVGLYVVADGMGGYRGGELASQLAVKTIADAFKSGQFEGDPHDSVPAHASELARAIQMANAAILETAKAQPELEGMGTTVCAARFSANKQRVFIGHVGDSRCYRLRDGVFEQMTADHTMADHGVKGPGAAHLSRAVGIWPTVPIDVVMGVPLENDVYLLCSDGLTKMLKDETIATVLQSEDDPKAAVERLVLFANSHGGKDNITVVLIRVVPPDWRPKPVEPFIKTGASSPPPAS